MQAQVMLVLGGARSGKSQLAEDWTLRFPGPHTYIATAEARDGEMTSRIARHRARRGSTWVTIEEPVDIVPALIHGTEQRTGPVLIDCLTLWLTNFMLSGRDWEAEAEALMALLPRLRRPVILVSTEVGLGIVPETPLGRDFRDAAGLLNQGIAAVADTAALVVAGLPLMLKGAPPRA